MPSDTRESGRAIMHELFPLTVVMDVKTQNNLLDVAFAVADRLGADWKTEIRDPNDEAVAHGNFHIERMDDDSWWMAVYGTDGHNLRICLFTKRGAQIISTMEHDGCSVECDQ